MPTPDQYRYGLYLRPDRATAAAVLDAHALLRAQYGLRVAALFPPHVTVKGFFRSDAPPETMRERLERALRDHEAFTVVNAGVRPRDEDGIVLDVARDADGRLNEAFQELQDRVWDALLPLVHPACEFTPGDPRGRDGPNPYRPHVSLAQDDLRPERQPEVLAFLRDGDPIGPPAFRARTLHLLRFEAAWEWKDAWHHDLRWTLLHTFDT